jgi:hypothetical protein
MTAISFPDFTAPVGWTNLTATAGYTTLLGLDVQVVCKPGGGAIYWGGVAAPTARSGIPLEAGSSDFETAVAQIWLYGPTTYAITQR